MDDVANAPSNGADDSVQPIETQVVEAEKPASSAREALDRAFAKLDKPDEPAKEPAKSDRPRDETGKFAKAEAKTEAKAEVKPEVEAKTDVKPVDVKPQIAPPPGFTKAAQDAWAQTPEAVRADTERRISELTNGLEQYKTQAQAFEPLRKYDEMARKSGTTLDKALEAYTGIEDALSRDPVAAIAQICKNIGVDARAIGAVLANAQQLPQPPRDDPNVSALKAEIEALKNQLGGFTKSFSEREAQATIDAFAKQNPYFDELSETITKMIETRFATDLSDAYQKAIRLNPEIAAKIQAEEDAKKAPAPNPAQTREKAKLSITGSPAAGSTPGSRKAPASAREALDSAFASLGL